MGLMGIDYDGLLDVAWTMRSHISTGTWLFVLIRGLISLGTFSTIYCGFNIYLSLTNTLFSLNPWACFIFLILGTFFTFWMT